MKYKFKPSHIVPAFLFVVAVLYGGSKPSLADERADDDRLYNYDYQLRLAHRLAQAGSLLRLATYRFSRCVPLPGRHQLH